MWDYVYYFLYHRARRSREPLYSAAALYDALLVCILVVLMNVIPAVFILKKAGYDVAEHYDALSSRGRYMLVLGFVVSSVSLLWVIARRKRHVINDRFKHFESLPNGIYKKGNVFVFIVYGFTVVHFLVGLLL